MDKTGRPWGFYKGEAIKQATQLCWAHGYEATSVAQRGLFLPGGSLIGLGPQI